MTENSWIDVSVVRYVCVADSGGYHFHEEFVGTRLTAEDILKSPVGICVCYDGFCRDGVGWHHGESVSRLVLSMDVLGW